MLVGHSHVALALGWDGSELIGGLAPAETEAALPDRRWLLNPGSVGQPRDGDARAAWLLVDTASGRATFRRVEYPIERTQAEMSDADLPLALGGQALPRNLTWRARWRSSRCSASSPRAVAAADPRLARTDVAPLIALANRVAAEGPCAQERDLAAVRKRAISLVNRKVVPADLQEPLLAGVNDLADRAVVCVPRVTLPPAAAAVAPGGDDNVEPVPHAASTSQQARNLAAWLERYSR